MSDKLMKHKGLALLSVLLVGLAVAAFAAAPKCGTAASGCSSCDAGVAGPEGKAKADADPHVKLVARLDAVLKDLAAAEALVGQGKRKEALESLEKVKVVIKSMRDRADAAAKAGPPAIKGWTQDYDKALEYAAKSKRPILLDFTGSDWCGWCIKLHDEVFVKDAFKAYADKNLVLVELDFPRSKPQSDEVKKRNRALAQKYGVRGFPTIVVLDSTGKKVLGRTGYVRGGPDAFIAEVKKIIGK